MLRNAGLAARELHVSVRRINWLGISLNVVFLPVSLATPFFCSRYGLRNACLFAAVCLVLGTWIRFIGVSRHHRGGYGIIVIGQVSQKDPSFRFLLGLI